MRDQLDLGCTPAEEKCEQLGPNYRQEVAMAECRAYIHQLERMFGKAEDCGCRFKVTRNPHDFGTYLDVTVVYDSDNKLSVDYAFNVEANCPANWDDEALKELEGVAMDNINKCESDA